MPVVEAAAATEVPGRSADGATAPPVVGDSRGAPADSPPMSPTLAASVPTVTVEVAATRPIRRTVNVERLRMYGRLDRSSLQEPAFTLDGSSSLLTPQLASALDGSTTGRL